MLKTVVSYQIEFSDFAHSELLCQAHSMEKWMLNSGISLGQSFKEVLVVVFITTISEMTSLL